MEESFLHVGDGRFDSSLLQLLQDSLLPIFNHHSLLTLVKGSHIFHDIAFGTRLAEVRLEFVVGRIDYPLLLVGFCEGLLI